MTHSCHVYFVTIYTSSSYEDRQIDRNSFGSFTTGLLAPELADKFEVSKRTINLGLKIR